MSELFNIFMIFFRMGAFTFGGGYAMLPIIQEEIVNKRMWATDDEILDYYAIGQCTPGIIAINTATFIGYKRKGLAGAVAATSGMVSPSLILLTIIGKFFKEFQDYQLVQHAFNGIQIIVGALIIITVINMFKHSVKDYTRVFIFLIAFIIISVLKISPIVAVVISALIGILKFKNKEIEGE